MSQRLFYILHLFKAVHFIRITRDFYRVYFMLINKDYLKKMLYIIHASHSKYWTWSYKFFVVQASTAMLPPPPMPLTKFQLKNFNMASMTLMLDIGT